jgi:hypothetical protein
VRTSSRGETVEGWFNLVRLEENDILRPEPWPYALRRRLSSSKSLSRNGWVGSPSSCGSYPGRRGHRRQARPPRSQKSVRHTHCSAHDSTWNAISTCATALLTHRLTMTISLSLSTAMTCTKLKKSALNHLYYSYICPLAWA